MAGTTLRQVGGLETTQCKLRQIAGHEGNSAGQSPECECFGGAFHRSQSQSVRHGTAVWQVTL